MISKRIYLFTVLFLCVIVTKAQNIAINTTGAAANSSALLDVSSTSKGLLVPRVALQSLTDATTIASPATSLLVYSQSGIVPDGYYYNSGTSGSPVWVRLMNNGTPGSAWDILGNSGTTAGTHFIGTTDSKALVFKTVNTEWMRVLTNGTLKFTGTTTTSPGLWMESTINAAAGTAYGILSRGNLTASANSDRLIPFATNLGIVTPGAFTGVNFLAAEIDASSWTKSGGTISNAYGLAVYAPTIGTNNYAGVFTGGNVGIGTTAPAFPLDVSGVIRTSGTGFGGGVFLRNTTAVTGVTYSVYSNNAGQFVIGDEVLNVAKFGMNSGLTGSAFITNIGNFGIGTAGPADKLEVNGGNILVTNGAAYNGALYSGDANWGFKIQRTAATDDYNVRMSYYPASGSRRAGIYNANASNWVLYADHNATPNIVMNNISSVGIGTANPDQSVAIDVESNKRILALLGNTTVVTATDGVSQAGLSVQAIFSPSANTSSVGFVNVLPQLAPSAGITVSNAYGIKIGALQSGAGTVTNGYGVYVDMLNYPFGTNKYPGIFLGGNVGIGTATPCTNLEVIGNIRASGWIYGNWAGSSACPSDIRYKKEIQPLANALNGIMKLQGVNYYLKVNEFPEKFFSSGKQIGLIAQDVEKIFPDLVITDKDGYKAVDYTRLTPILIEALKEQQKLIEEQNMKIERMNNLLGALQLSVQVLQGQISSAEKK